MTTALMFASISDLRRMAVDIYTLIELQARVGADDLYKKYSDVLQRFTEVLKTVVNSIKSTKHIALLDEPWDEILLRIAHDNLINVDEKTEVAKYINNIAKYLVKLGRENLKSYELLELKKFLTTLIDVLMKLSLIHI